MKTQTKLIAATTVAAVVLGLAGWAQTAKPISLKTMPASVVKTVPPAGATGVDPALKEISVTFSKDMLDGSWSVCQSTPNENYPETPDGGGGLRYLPDKRTCVMPVKLQPGRTYVLWFNRGQYQNFRDTDRLSSVPYLLVFETRK
jgi:hypothetical protein